MHRHIDPSSERFSRRARGLAPEYDPHSTPSQSKDSTAAPSLPPPVNPGLQPSINQPSLVNTRLMPPLVNTNPTPSVCIVYTSDTNSIPRSSSGISQVTLFPEEILGKNSATNHGFNDIHIPMVSQSNQNQLPPRYEQVVNNTQLPPPVLHQYPTLSIKPNHQDNRYNQALPTNQPMPHLNVFNGNISNRIPPMVPGYNRQMYNQISPSDLPMHRQNINGNQQNSAPQGRLFE